MKKIILFSLMAFTISMSSYSQYNPPPSGGNYAVPLQIDSSDLYIFGKNIDKSNRSKYYFPENYRVNTIGWTNVIIYNTATHQNVKLFENILAYISPVTTFSSNYSGWAAYASVNSMGKENHLSIIVNDKIIFMVKTDNYNKDGIINDDDGKSIFISNKDGSGLKQITPDNMNVISFILSKDAKTILLNVQNDTNGDKKFTNEDDESMYQIDLNNDISKINLMPVNL